MAVAYMNKTRGLRSVGATRIAPGTAAVVTDDSWTKNKVVQAWIKEGMLEKVPLDAVDKINSGMDVKKAIAGAKADEQMKDEGTTTTTAPTPPVAGGIPSTQTTPPPARK